MNPEQFKSVTTVDDNYLVTAFGAARRRIVLMAPGVSGRVAEGLAQAWERLGGNAVSVILDVDPEICRLGYGDEKGLTTLQGIATKLGQTLCHEPGTRIGLLIVDDRTVVYSPTPLLIEAQPNSSAGPEVGSLFPGRPRPNAVVLGEPPAELASELGAGPEGAESRSLGLDSVQAADMEALKDDLTNNPPLKFDVARYERVFNARIEFVELEVLGCSVSRHTASIPSDLMGLADNSEAANRLRSTFKVIGENDTVDAAGELSEKTLKDERKRIADEYLISLPNYGTVILRKNRPDFEREIEELKKKVTAFGEGLKTRLSKLIDTNAAKLVEALLPKVAKARPTRWKKFVGSSPTEQQCRVQLEQDIRGALGSAEALIKEMKVSLLFKGVTYQTLTDPDFRELVEQKIPGLELMQEYDAARGEETGDVSDGENDSHP
jgi:hypothetical protein